MIDSIPLSMNVNTVVGVTPVYVARPTRGGTVLMVNVEVIGARVRQGKMLINTFADADVNVATDEITEVGHPYVTGDGPYYLTTTVALPAGLLTATPYYVVKTGNDTFLLVLSYEDAMSYAGYSTAKQDQIRVDITGAAGGGTNTIGTALATAAATHVLGNASILLGVLGTYALDSPNGVTLQGTAAGSKINYWWA
jgi:hypothetical protein